MNPLETHPKKVALVALGTSSLDFMGHIVGNQCEDTFDEVWTVNMGITVFRHDKLFVMDDLRELAKQFPNYGRLLREHDRPIITSAVYPEYPKSIRFPIEEVVEKIGDDYFTNTVCYTIAYAMVSGVKDLFLFGCDFFYPKLQDREEGGMNSGYLLGLARYYGMKYHLPRTTTLLGANRVVDCGENTHRPLYGYKVQPLFSSGGVNGTGIEQGPQLRASEGHDAGAVEQGQPLRPADKRQGNKRKSRKGRSPGIHTRGEDVQRRRRGAGRSSRVGMADGEQARPNSEGRVRDYNYHVHSEGGARFYTGCHAHDRIDAGRVGPDGAQAGA